MIQSSNFQTGVSGFRMKADGELEANNGTFRGHIEAESGYIDNVIIKEEAMFLGTISSGPIYASNEMGSVQPGTVFASGTSISNIITHYGANKTINTSSGSYGTKVGLSGIKTTRSSGYNPNAGSYSIETLSLLFNDGSSELFERYVNAGYHPNQRSNIDQNLTVGGGLPGKILRFNNLPTGPGATKGDIYESNGVLMVTK